MASADRLFNARALGGALDADAAEQLRHAALALAGMPAGMAAAITCTRHIERDQLMRFAGLARRVAAENMLRLLIEQGDPVSVRFFRRPDHRAIRRACHGCVKAYER